MPVHQLLEIIPLLLAERSRAGLADILISCSAHHRRISPSEDFDLVVTDLGAVEERRQNQALLVEHVLAPVAHGVFEDIPGAGQTSIEMTGLHVRRRERIPKQTEARQRFREVTGQTDDHYMGSHLGRDSRQLLSQLRRSFLLILQKEHDRLRRSFAGQMIERLLYVFRAGANAVDEKHLAIRTEIEILQRGFKAR